MNKFKRFNTVLFKLTASHIIIAALAVIFVGIFVNIIYTSYFNKQIETSNNIILNNLKDFIDKDILEKADSIYLSMISDDSDMQQYLDIQSSGTTDYKKIKNVSEILKNQQVLNADWCMNLYIYEGESNTLIGINGIINNQTGARNQRPEWFGQIIESQNGFSYLPTVSLDSIFVYSKQNGCILVRKLPRVREVVNDSYLFCEVSEEAFAAVMRKTAEEGAELLIVDSEGNVISSTESIRYPYNVSGQEYFGEIVQSGESSGFFKSRVDGTKSVVAYSTIERYNWIVLDIMPVKMYYHASNLVNAVVVIACLITILLAFIISNFFARSIYNPIKTIINGIRGEDKEGSDNEYAIINTAIMNMSGAITNLEETIENNRPLIKNNLVQSLIYHKITTSEELEDFLKITGRHVSGEGFTASLLKLDKSVIEKLTIENGSVILYNIINEIEGLDNSISSYIAAQHDSESIVLIGIHKNTDRDELMKDAQYLEDYIASNYYMSCIMIIGSIVDTPLELYRSFDSVITAQKYKFLMPKLSVVFANDINYRDESNIVMSDEYINEFRKCLNVGSSAKSRKALHAILNELIQGDYNASYCNSKMLEIVSVVANYLKANNIKSTDPMYTEIINGFGKVEDIYEFEEWLVKIIDRIFAFAKENTKDSTIVIVDNVKEYVINNIAEDLSLNAVSEKVFVSPQYLSKVFKEHMGMNFSEYVTNCRMEKAAELLLSENASVETIAGMVGYNTPHYFIKKFKEKYGVTPKMYRINYS